MTQSWENVYVFISSTFDDMHAERDELVKRVFPRLQDWCERRKLRLVDIDLRWGVTETDATGRNVVKVCLDFIDQCRPFFLCFLGQRYGWVPRRAVSPDTFDHYPDLKQALDQDASVTEIEVRHALLSPFSKKGQDARPSPAEFSFFYFREPDYLPALPDDPEWLPLTYVDLKRLPKERQELLRIYADLDPAAEPQKLEAYLRGDDLLNVPNLPDDLAPGPHNPLARLRRLKAVLIPSTGRPRRFYRATWSPVARTPEIALPVECPSEEADDWRKKWKEAAGIDIPEKEVRIPDQEMATAARFNERLTAGRLAGFHCKNAPLGEAIFDDLTQAIEARFPEHREAPEEDDLQRELDRHEEFISAAREVFIQHGGVEKVLKALDEYVSGDDHRLFLLTAEGGLGKSTLLAWWVDQLREKWQAEPSATVNARFVGVGDRSANVDSLIEFLLRELRAAGKLEGELPDDPNKRRLQWAELLKACGAKGKTLIVVDAINQLDSGLSDLGWLERPLPPNVKLVVSFKTGESKADDLLCRLQDDPNIYAQIVEPIKSPDDRKKLVNHYLSQYLKALDEKHIDALVNVEGAQNPLFLKVVLAELRVFGAHGLLGERIRRDFGGTPLSAFTAALHRMEADPAYTAIEPRRAVTLLFGALAHARRGLPEDLLARLFVAELPLPDTEQSYDDAIETIRLYLRQMRPFLARREQRHDFFYETFVVAARERYAREVNELGCRPTADWHRAIAAVCEKWEELSGASRRYAVANLPAHLAEAGQINDLVPLLENLAFLEAKVVAGMTFELTGDFAQALRVVPSDHPERKLIDLLDEALRRDIYFIARHADDYPQGLFQCLWNSGWWYDCPEEKKHYIEPEGGWKTPPPWKEPGRKFHKLLEHAKAKRERTYPAFIWLRSLRPPMIHLGTAQKTVFQGHTGDVTSVAFSPDGKYIVSGSDDDTLRLWDAHSGACINTLKGHTSIITSVAFSPDGARIVSGSYDDTLRLWDVHSGACINTLKGHTRIINSVAFSPDGARIVSGSGDDTLRLWDAQSGACIKTLKGHTYSESVNSVAFSPDGARIVSDLDRTLRIWDAQSGTCINTLKGHTSIITSVAFSPDGTRIVSGSGDGTLRLWDAHSGACNNTLKGRTRFIISVAFSPDGTRIISCGSDDDTLRLWDAHSGACINTLKGHTGSVNSVAFSPDGTRIISGSGDKTLRLWDAQSDACINTLKGHTKGGISSVAFSPDGARIISGGRDLTLRLWDAQSGACINTLKGHTYGVNSVAFSPDGARIVSGSYDDTLRLWDAQSGACVKTLKGHTYGVNSVAFSPDGARIISGGGDLTLRLWDAHSGACINTLKGHKINVKSVAFSPDGAHIVSVSDDTLRLWDAHSGACINTLKTPKWHTSSVNSVAFSPDGARIVSGSGDDTLRLWDAQSGDYLGVIQGKGDIAAIAAGSELYPFLALVRDGETIIEDASTGSPVAWFPVQLEEITTHHAESLWAGGDYNNLCLILLERGRDKAEERHARERTPTWRIGDITRRISGWLDRYFVRERTR